MEAADQIRDGGLASVSVGKLMKSVSLTHSGFYVHFASRADLLAQALKRALVDGARQPPRRSSGARAFASIVKNCLNRNHRDAQQAEVRRFPFEKDPAFSAPADIRLLVGDQA
ncbi:TetR family transcriptional regulator [Rhizobium laguerreae]|uniref:TetR family transcriptional regulator n=1 Tax=Rhizobium laguerreae TaxID=1076926 RepID=UPI001FEB6331|nr:TetR family transcriptional regulator [Rhizobium laguerreae]